MSRPKLEVADIFRRHGAAWRTANKAHLSLRGVSCVDGPRLARDNFACRTEVACSHVSGLFMQSGWTAGPDGVREPRPHHSSGIDVPMNRQASLGCVGTTDCAITRHYSLASSSVGARAKPPRREAGIPSGAASPPRRCAPSCSPAPRLRPAAAAACECRSPTDRPWSPSSAADWRLLH
jgi:hypothetical protein